MLRHLCIFFFLLLTITPLSAQKNKVQTTPFIDQRRLHFGFSVGTHVQDLRFSHSGNVTVDGDSFYSEIPSFSPGFNVGLVSDLYINPYLSLRFTPTMYFGNKTVEIRNNNTGETVSNDIKSNYLAFPVHIKFSSKRLNNYRPYITAGVSPTLDLAKKKNELLQLKTYDTYLEIGLGCDIYLPFFKLIPELKFCFGLSNVLQRNRKDLQDPLDYKYTQAYNKISSQMVVLSFYFE